MAMPSVFAVFKLMTKSHFVGCRARRVDQLLSRKPLAAPAQHFG
jgi:hypothetical protein